MREKAKKPVRKICDENRNGCRQKRKLFFCGGGARMLAVMISIMMPMKNQIAINCPSCSLTRLANACFSLFVSWRRGNYASLKMAADVAGNS